jgi:EAL and modified HD-GYP domain-containing signal transduction protein
VHLQFPPFVFWLKNCQITAGRHQTAVITPEIAMIHSNLPIRLGTADLENIKDALKVICIARPSRARQALAALNAFQHASGGQYFDITLAHLEIACEALASRYQKTSGPHRERIDDAIERLTAMSLRPVGHDSCNDELDHLANIVLNRRPICDRTHTVRMYEPHFRCFGASLDSPENAAHAGRHSLNLVDENFEDLAGQCKMLIHIPNELMASGEYQRFPRDRVTIRIAEAEGEQLDLNSLMKPNSDGYTLALPEAMARRHFSAVTMADIIRVDVQLGPKHALSERVEILRSYEKKLLAVGVNTAADFQLCNALKFDFFEGQFLLAPDTKALDIPLTTLSTVRLITALQNPDVRLHELEHIVQQSLPLSYKLLRFLNSAYVGLPRAVMSIRHAVALAGMRRIQQWMSLMLFSSIQNKPEELFTIAAIRARMCEQLADTGDDSRRAMFFTVGLLSVLDAVLDVPMVEVVRALPLSVEVCDALIQCNGPIGDVLKAVIAYERSDWDELSQSRFSLTALRDSYLQSLHWAIAEAAVMSDDSGANDRASLQSHSRS